MKLITGIKLTLFLSALMLALVLSGMYFRVHELAVRVEEQRGRVDTQAALLTGAQRDLEMRQAETEAFIQGLYDVRELPEKIAALQTAYVEGIVALEQKIRAGESDAKIAYLTFDDGPFKRTKEYLEVLRRYDAKGTFFVVGKPGQETRYREILSEGHNLANHTYSHQIKDGIYRSPDAFLNDVNKLQRFLFDSFGQDVRIVRFPGGSATAGSLKSAIKSRLYAEGYGWVDWNAATNDGLAGYHLTDEIAYNVFVQSMGQQKIIVSLMHDHNLNSLNALPRIIEMLQEKGYLLLPLYYESCMIHKS